MPTPPMPGWKLPVAVGCRSPILRVAFTQSMERSCGDCRTLVRASLITAWSSALGTVSDQSAVESRPRLDNGTALLPPVVVVVVGVVVVGVVVVPVGVVVGVVGVVTAFGTTARPLRGVKFTGTFKPPGASAAVSCRV